MDVSPTYQAPVEVKARYVITPFSGGKRLQGVYLHLEDGSRWIRAYRPIPEEYRFADKWVVVKGRPYTPSPLVQSVDGVHFELAAIALANGETPYAVPPTQIPIPPKVSTQAEIAQRLSLWVHCSGTITELQTAKFGSIAQLHLNDGTSLSFTLTSASFERRVPPTELSRWIGQTVTVLGQVKTDTPPTLGLVRICTGILDHCPIDNPKNSPSKKFRTH